VTASGELAHSARRLSAQRREQLAAMPAPEMFWATVTTVTAGAAGDGNVLVKVTWRGRDFVVRYPDTYTPALNHRVLVANVENQPGIVGHYLGGL
jgi:hypothetical protein